jgi:hypothetical protein
VAANWDKAAQAGLTDLLERVPAAAAQAQAHPVVYSGDFAGAPFRVPGYRLSLSDVQASLGRAIVLGQIDLEKAAKVASLCVQAVLGLRALDDVLGRISAAQSCVDVTSADRAVVLALYRVEGNLGIPPSYQSLIDGVPSGTSSEITLLNPRPDISNLVWLVDPAILGESDPIVLRHMARFAFMVQLAGLDIASSNADRYQNWSYDVWKTVGVDAIGKAIARSLFFQGAVRSRELVNPTTKVKAVACMIEDPVAFTATTLSDAVQLFKSYQSTKLLIGENYPNGIPDYVNIGVAYLRYNLGDDGLKSIMACALTDAANTRNAKTWPDLHQRVLADQGLAPYLQASRRGLNVHSLDGRKQYAELTWPRVLAWCRVAGNLGPLMKFMEEGSLTDWGADWETPRANMTRFRVIWNVYRYL